MRIRQLAWLIPCLLVACRGGSDGTTTAAFAEAEGASPASAAQVENQAPADILTLAEQGDAEAQFNLARMYATGQGFPRDPLAALEWLQRAAEQGHAPAQNQLGGMYARGDLGAPQDYPAARQWFEKAAAQGLAGAQYNLALMYARGLGGSQSTLLAQNLAGRAAEQGDERAAELRDTLGEQMAVARQQSQLEAALNPSCTSDFAGWQEAERARTSRS